MLALSSSARGRFWNERRWKPLASVVFACAVTLTGIHPAWPQSIDQVFFNGFEVSTVKVAEPDIELALADPSVWAALKDRCDTDLDTLIVDIYAGFDWRQAAQDYGVCYNVALRKADPAASLYSKKAVAILKVLSRNFPVIAKNQNYQFLAFGDGKTAKFTLPMPPLTGSKVRVFSSKVGVNTFTYAAAGQADVTRAFDAGSLYPVLRVSNTKTGATTNDALEYTPELDFHVSMRDDDLVRGITKFNVLHWLGSNHPSGTYYVATKLNETGADNVEIPKSDFSIDGTTLTFDTTNAKTPPADDQALFVQYLGSDYTQTINGAGGVESVKPDGPGYNMRAMSAGLAYGFDAMRQSPDLTSTLRHEFYSVLNGQLDWYTQGGYEGPNIYPNPIGNYYIRGYLTSAMFTAYATDFDNPRAMPAGDIKTLARTLLMQTFNKMQAVLPGGYGPQGTYSEGTNEDMLQLYDLWKRLTTTDGAPEDLAPQLEWNANLVPASIHGTKPDRVTFYDGGDWNTLPADPLMGSMQAFIKYEPSHPMAPYARQLLADLGSAVSGVKTDYKTGAGAFPLSYLAKFTGPLYARSDWGTNAIWVSMAAGPVVEDHQHEDQGHITLQRGADYLVINSGGYGIIETLPWHNTLGFDDTQTSDPHSVYPPGQGDWGDKAKIAKFIDQGAFVYSQADIADAYVNNDGTSNSVLRALRTFVYIRPNIVLVHDNMKVADGAVKKIFNLNFNAPSLAQSDDVFSASHGASKVFMRALVPALIPANPSPNTITLDYNGGVNNVTNYQMETTGETAGTFLHLFELTASNQTMMASSNYVQTTDGREQGAEVDMGSRRWIVLASTGPSPVPKTGALVYAVHQACPCTHVVTDLPPSTMYTVTIKGVGGTIQSGSDATGVLTFQTDDSKTTGIQIN